MQWQLFYVAQVIHVLQKRLRVHRTTAEVGSVLQHRQRSAATRASSFMIDGFPHLIRVENAALTFKQARQHATDQAHGSVLEIVAVPILLDEDYVAGPGVHLECNLPGHGCGGQEHPRLHTKIVSDSLLQLGYRGVFTFGGVTHLSVVNGLAHAVVGEGERVGAQVYGDFHGGVFNPAS